MPCTLDDPTFQAATARHHAAARGQRGGYASLVAGVVWSTLTRQEVGHADLSSRAKDLYLPISPEQGRFVYGVARAIGARRIVEFGTSLGLSTMYLAAAVRDNGGGQVIGSELEPSKVNRAREHLAEVGLGDLVDVREGDAMVTLRDVGGPVDLLLLDGWKDLYLPVFQMLDPHLRSGAVVLGDNILTFKKSLKPFVDHVQDRANGYTSLTLPLADGFEFAVKL